MWPESLPGTILPAGGSTQEGGQALGSDPQDPIDPSHWIRSLTSLKAVTAAAEAALTDAPAVCSPVNLPHPSSRSGGAQREGRRGRKEHDDKTEQCGSTDEVVAAPRGGEPEVGTTAPMNALPFALPGQDGGAGGGGATGGGGTAGGDDPAEVRDVGMESSRSARHVLEEESVSGGSCGTPGVMPGGASVAVIDGEASSEDSDSGQDAAVVSGAGADDVSLTEVLIEEGVQMAEEEAEGEEEEEEADKENACPDGRGINSTEPSYQAVAAAAEVESESAATSESGAPAAPPAVLALPAALAEAAVEPLANTSATIPADEAVDKRAVLSTQVGDEASEIDKENEAPLNGAEHGLGFPAPKEHSPDSLKGANSGATREQCQSLIDQQDSQMQPQQQEQEEQQQQQQQVQEEGKGRMEEREEGEGELLLGEGGIVATFLSGLPDSPIMPGMTRLGPQGERRKSKRISWHLQHAMVR